MTDETNQKTSETAALTHSLPQKKPKLPALASATKTSRKTSRSRSPSTTRMVAPQRSKRHTPEEKQAKIGQIESDISNGAMTLKDAVQKAGISDETYYQWKRSAKLGEPTMTGSDVSDEIDDLLALEKENLRLRTILAERLRKENAELRRRLKLD